jgi:serine/threonine-protein kinase
LAPSAAAAQSAAPASQPGTPAALLALGDELLAGLWQEIELLPAIAGCAERSNLGVAHGWAGYLYATLQWCRAARRTLPASLSGRLDELAAAAESWGRGVRWRWHGMPADLGGHLSAAPGGAAAPYAARWMAGWCNGSAGMVHLFALAARLLVDDRSWQLACAAGWNTWEAADTGGSLCCGIAGRAYALLDLYRQGAGDEWLTRARALAARAATSEPTALPDSLYRGRLGVALLAADLARPDTAAMPLFADEGWSSRPNWRPTGNHAASGCRAGARSHPGSP